MYVVLKRPWRGYPAEEPIDMPASDARSALNAGVGMHGTEWKRKQQPETTSRSAPEDTSARRGARDYGGRCGAELDSGGLCSRETDGGRCWQHEEE